MGSGVPGLDRAYEILFIICLIVLAALLIGGLVRAIIGPRVADRLVAVNVIGTMVMAIIGILAVMYQKEYLADICLIYALISFLAVVVLTKVYMGDYRERQAKEEGEENDDSN